jgi:hypothetical protein
MSLEGTLVYIADSVRFSLSLFFIVFKVIVLLLLVVQLNVEVVENFEKKKIQLVLNVTV